MIVRLWWLIWFFTWEMLLISCLRFHQSFFYFSVSIHIFSRKSEITYAHLKSPSASQNHAYLLFSQILHLSDLGSLRYLRYFKNALHGFLYYLRLLSLSACLFFSSFFFTFCFWSFLIWLHPVVQEVTSGMDWRCIMSLQPWYFQIVYIKWYVKYFCI